MSKEIIVPASQQHQVDKYRYSTAYRLDNGLIILAGQMGATLEDPEMGVLEEFRNAWKRIGEVLAEAGKGYEDIIDIMSYHVDLHDHLGNFMKVKDEFIKSEPWPAWTAVGVSTLGLPYARVEIKVTAV